MKKEIKNQDLNNVSGGVLITDEGENCPNCNSKKIAHTTNGCNDTTYTCKNCGHTWSNK